MRAIKDCHDSLVDKNQWNKIREKTDYPNLEEVKEMVLKLESNLAKNFADMKSFRLNSDSQLEIDFEWFLTWRLKIAKFPHIIWCDGVEIESFRQSGKLRFEIETKALLGPESNVNLQFMCNMNGFLVLTKKFDRFESYKLEIEYENQKYCIDKSF